MTALTQVRGRANLSEDAQLVLQTISDTGERYADNYLIRILRGDDTFSFRDPDHRSLATFGVLAEVYSEKLRCFFHYLIGEGLLERTDPIGGKICLTEKGQAFFAEPYELEVALSRLRPNTLERLIRQKLIEIRTHVSGQDGIPPYQIFTDYMLHTLAQNRPNTVQELGKIPGFGPYKLNRYGAAILQGLSQAYAQHQELTHNKLIRSARNRAHQLTKSLYEAGLSEAEIAQQREIKPVTVRTQLINLHRAGEIDLSQWIETQLDSGILAKGVSFFEGNEGARMREAYETTGLDYDTLRLCRLYVSQVSLTSSELAIS